MGDNRHELVHFPGGKVSVRGAAGEAMHSSIGAWEEAQQVYVLQSRLAERLSGAMAGAGIPETRPADETDPVVLYDLGLGIAANALAAVECALAMGDARRRELHVVSFENDVSGLGLALSCADQFPFLERHREKVKKLFEGGVWEWDSRGAPGIRWECVRGDFRDVALEAGKDVADYNLPAQIFPAPEIIFYDFYSPATSPELWGLGCFSKLWSVCAPRSKQGRPTTLVTYCTATAARSAMLLAGFRVGRGRPTDAKRETTVATTLHALRVNGDISAASSGPQSEALPDWLNSAWLRKLQTSSKPLPADLAVFGLTSEEALDQISRLGQFNELASG